MNTAPNAELAIAPAPVTPTLAEFVGELTRGTDLQAPVNRPHARRIVGGRNHHRGARARARMRAWKQTRGLS